MRFNKNHAIGFHMAALLKPFLLITVLLTLLGCGQEKEQAMRWHNAFDIERELYLLGQEEDPRVIYRRLQSIKQQASLQISQLREQGKRDVMFNDWLEALRISLSLAPIHSNDIAQCSVWQNAMEKAWGVPVREFNERAKLVWRVMVATCNGHIRSL